MPNHRQPFGVIQEMPIPENNIAKRKNQLKELDEEVKTKINEIRDSAKAVIEHQFCGWNIYHRFRCANGLGVQQISDILIIVDENLEMVKGRFMLDDNDDYSLDKLKKTIDKAIGKDRK